MKKNYFMLAAAAMMFAACSETDMVSEMGEMEKTQEISFESFANKTTRAIAGPTDLQTAGFQVWGYKAPTATPMVWTNQYTVFNNVAVSYASGDWGYTGKKYWDKKSTYNFYAVAPSSASAYYSIAPTTGMISITGAESAKSTVSKDYVIDRNGVTNVDGNYTGSAHDDVEFDFNHIMSKLSFKLAAGITENITVTRLTMTGWNSGNGNFTQILTATPTVTDYISEWNIPTAGTGSITLIGTGTGNETLTLTAAATPGTYGTAAPVTDTYIMVPQTIAANTLTFTIDFKIGDEVFTGQTGIVAAAQTWGTDTHTTYTINVAPNLINFDVNSVADWTNSGTGGTTIN